MRGLKDKTFIIAGGATGIGAATAERLASEGASVTVGDINGDGAKATAERITASGGRAVAVEFDLADEQSVQELVDRTIAEFGAVHGLHNVGADLSVNNLGRDTTVLETDMDVWQRTLDVNLLGYVRTLPQVMSAAGWYSALFGMQHETTLPSRLGFHEYDVSNAYCEYVAAQAAEWLRDRAADVEPFLLTAGFFEAHRPYPRERYTPADFNDVKVPDCWPDTDEVRRDFADFYGAVAAADAAVGQLLDVLDATGLDANTWVVFVTDHGPAFPRAMSTLYDAGTGIALIVRPPRAAGVTPRSYDELFSGVDLLPTLLGLLGVDTPTGVDGVSHARNLLASPPETTPVRNEIFTAKAYHDSFDQARAVRTKEYSYIENYNHRPAPSKCWDIETGASVKVTVPDTVAPQPERELYDLVNDPNETRNLLATPTDHVAAVADRLATALRAWRQNTGHVVVSEHSDAQLSEHYAGLYWQMHNAGRRSGRAIAGPRLADRGHGIRHI